MKSSRPDLRPVLEFLSLLKKNNDRTWFEKNRALYEHAMGQFEMFVGCLLEGLGKVVDLDGVTPKDCIMRIYRDVRFSKDKKPYKTGLGAGIAPGGRKSGTLGCHLHMEPGGATMVAGGLWEPMPPQLSRFRDAVSRDAAGFKKILAAAAFKRHFGQVTGEKLKTAPQGFTVDHPEIELLRFKQVCVMERFDDESVLSSGFVDLALESANAMTPFIDYLNRVAVS
jgi:uncharacterized protein (TIGR02453 family)